MRPLLFSINVTLAGYFERTVGFMNQDYGRFACVYDPEGNKIELWEPK